ncbi:GLPGLI family protein [Chryseobacterium sp. KACC 21268]|nr:GLPGLI family protein [Chryseobacterium sp. KACC 21268]
MTLRYLFSTLIFISSLLRAQEINRFIYELKYREDSTSTIYHSEKMFLDADEKDFTFRSYDRFIMDSLYNSDNSKEYDDVGKFLYVIEKKEKKSDLSITEFQGAIRYKYDDNVALNWSITNEKKLDGRGKRLQKAEVFFRGRKWNAFFDAEIPINAGPYKFYGLPGLIVEIYDDRRDYNFKLIGNYKKPRKDIGVPVFRYVEKDLKVSKARFFQIIDEYKKDPARDFKAGVYNGTIKLVDRDPNEIIRGIEEKYREEQKKFNNPIELVDQ